MSDLRTRIAALLTDHAAAEYSWGVDGCACDADTGGDREAQAQHQADVLIRELPELQYAHVPQRVQLGPLKAIQHQQASKELRDPDMIAADQEWRDKHAACLNCKVTLDELQAWQAVVDGELVRPLCRGCWTATTAGECKRGGK